jgi:hypothetical protein
MFHREDGRPAEYLEPAAGDERIACAVLRALEKSRFVWPPDEPDLFNADRYLKCYRDWQKDFMRRYGYRTKSEAYKSLKWCLVTRSEGKISIQPHQRDKPQYFRDMPEDQTVIIATVADITALSAALKLALDRCK